MAISNISFYLEGDNRNSRCYKKYYLENWFMQVWHYWLNILEQNNDLPSFVEAEHTRILYAGLWG